MDKISMYINDLLVQNNVSLKKIYDCSVKQKETISQIKKIFDSKTYNDYLLTMTVLRVIEGNKAENIIGYFKKDCGIDYNPDDKYFDDNKILVLTAFIFNPSFFSMAVNMHGLIMHELQRQNSSAALLSEKLNDLKEKVSDLVSKEKYVNLNIPAFQLNYISASTSNHGLIEIMRKDNIDLGGIKGTLIINGSEKNKIIQFKFEFPRPNRTFPFNLEISYTTKADNKKHKIILEKINEYTLVSPEKNNINFTGSLTVNRIRKSN